MWEGIDKIEVVLVILVFSCLSILLTLNIFPAIFEQLLMR